MPYRLKIKVRENSIEVDGDFTKAEILAMKDEWYSAIKATDQAMADALALLDKERATLSAAVDANQPTAGGGTTS